MANYGPGDFDADDKNSWYFGQLTRTETNSILLKERDSGVFLVRDSSSIKGDFVLCVREDNKVSHYIINKITVGGQLKFRIGDQQFTDLPSLLTFYKSHYLDTTSLVKPAPREKVKAKFDFAGRDPEDLPFKKGDILTILIKDEDQWWTAKNSSGDSGQIPVPYVVPFVENGEDDAMGDGPDYQNPGNNKSEPKSQNPAIPPCPFQARVTQDRVPSAYDTTALKLKVGDIIKVTKTKLDGQWEGELNGKQGHFPFTYVEIIYENDKLQDGDT